jgi:hypothetical protein
VTDALSSLLSASHLLPPADLAGGLMVVKRPGQQCMTLTRHARG